MSYYPLEDDVYQTGHPFDDRRGVYEADRPHFGHGDIVERDMARENEYYDRRDMYMRREELVERDELDRLYEDQRARHMMDERDRLVEIDRIERDRMEIDRIERDRMELDRIARDRIDLDRIERDQMEIDRMERAYYDEYMETNRMERERERIFEDRERGITGDEDFEMDDRQQDRFVRSKRMHERSQGEGRGRQGKGRGNQGQLKVSRDRSARGGRQFHGNKNQNFKEKFVPSKASSVHSREGSVRSNERSPARGVARATKATKATAASSVHEDPWTQWKSAKASPSVLLIGLPVGTDELDIYRLLYLFHSAVADVKIMHSSFGDSEKGGYGFVNFIRNTDAAKWMEANKSKLEIKGKTVTLCFATPNKRNLPMTGDKGWLKWATNTPCSNIVIWNINLSLEATEIEEAIKEEAKNLVCCKIIRHPGTGESRGFGFLEFKNQASAEKWFNESKGMILMSKKPMFATYSSGDQHMRKPWLCNKCGMENYKHREHCFTCKLSKSDSDKIISYDGADELGTNPCNTLVFQGLDALTCEDSLNNALYWATGVYCRQVIVMRDPITNVSMSYAFGEMSSVKEAKDVMETLASILEVDGKQVTVSFTKNTFNTIITTFTYSGQEPLQPVIFTPEEFKQNQSEAVAMEALAEAETLADEEFIEPEKKVSKKQKTEVTPDEKPDTSYINPMNMELEVINRFLFDPQTGKYYDNFTKIQCPVSDCKALTKWQTLRTHWKRAHIPTKVGYMCQVGLCKKKKVVHRGVGLLHEHFKKEHPGLKGKNYEEQTKRSKKVPVPNINCVDPGNAVLPMPKLTGGPKVDLPEQKCPIEACPHSYTTLEKMKLHWTQYHNTKVAMYRCCECDTMNRDKHFMQNHMKLNHKAKTSNLEKVMLDNKQLVDPGKVIPFWSLYREDEDDDLFEEENKKLLEERLGDDFPLASVPCPGNDPEDLAEFISWTQRYMNRLQVVSIDAMRDLKKLAKRKLEQ